MTTYEEERTEREKRIDKLVKDRVENGIMLLQRKYGDEWVEHIDLEALDLRSGNCCVLGQLYDHYPPEQESDLWESKYSKLAQSFWPEADGVYRYDEPGMKHGFTTRGLYNDERYDFDKLQEVWVSRIRELKEDLTSKV